MMPAGLPYPAPSKDKRPCSWCFREFHLLMPVGRLDLCAECWRKAGEPMGGVAPRAPRTRS